MGAEQVLADRASSDTRGGDGIYSNIQDFAKWDAALYTDKLLDADSRKLAFTPKDPIADPDTDYGFGWRLSGDTALGRKPRPFAT